MAPVSKRRQFSGFTSLASGRRTVVMIRGKLSTSDEQFVSN